MNRIDKAIAIAFPGWAERRAISRHNLKVMNELLPTYKGGSVTRRRNRVVASTSREDQALTTDYSNMIAAAMNLYRNDPMTRSIVDTTTNYMGESRPMATTGDTDFDTAATEYFNDFFWPQADARKRPGVDFGTLQSLWSKWAWLGGDMLFALWDGALYPYEGLQIQTPWDLRQEGNVVNGVRVEKTPPHRITHFYVSNADRPRLFTSAKEDFERLRYNECIFAPSKYWRAAMLRGVPELHAVIDALQDWEETNDDVQAKVKFDSKLFTVERKGTLGSLPGTKFTNVDSTNGTQVEVSKADYGMRFRVNGTPDQDFKLSTMNNPGAHHVPYMEYMGRIISAGVGLPYEIVMHLYTNGSYTANRAARTDFAKFIIDRWAWRNKVLNQRVWNWKIAQAMKSGDIPQAPTDSRGRSLWWKCTWTLPYFPQIDEGKEITADVRQWGACVNSLADIAQEQGRTRGQLLDAHDADISEMKTRAETLGVTLSEYAGELFKGSPAPTDEPDNGGTDAE